MKGIFYAVLIGHSLMFAAAVSADQDDPTPSAEIGAVVYGSRCMLCHGSQAMGDGVLPLKIKQYPDTNLLVAKKAVARKEINTAIVFGGMHKDYSKYMPPFGKELTWTELESVTDFVHLLRSDKPKALALITDHIGEFKTSRHLGKDIFSTRCVLCHGVYGEGDGRMSKILKNPPPADLTASRLPRDYLEKIIRLGGEAVGRSKHMPPWGDQLNAKEISILMDYLESIRD